MSAAFSNFTLIVLRVIQQLSLYELLCACLNPLWKLAEILFEVIHVPQVFMCYEFRWHEFIAKPAVLEVIIKYLCENLHNYDYK